MPSSPRHLLALDVLAGWLVGAASFGVAGNLWLANDDNMPVMALAVLAAVLNAAAVSLRRHWPRAMLALTLAVSLSGLLWDPFISVALVLYLATTIWPRPVSLAAAGVCLLGAWLGSFWLTAGWLFALFATAAVAVAWLAGDSTRQRRVQVIRVAAQQARQIRLDERLRIARELHDVVAHGMGLIAVKAQVANFVADTRPEETRSALRVIEQTSKEALAETRRLLSVLRAEEPQPPDLDELFARAAEAGVRIESAVDLPEGPEALRRNALRIVQEAVTNVIRHAAPTDCRVTVTNTGGVLTIDITNTGPTRDPRPGGHGLTGIEERVALYDGEFHAGPAPDGGFHLHATLPHRSPA